jgi:hypothetical protein
MTDDEKGIFVSFQDGPRPSRMLKTSVIGLKTNVDLGRLAA